MALFVPILVIFSAKQTIKYLLVQIIGSQLQQMKSAGSSADVLPLNNCNFRTKIIIYIILWNLCYLWNLHSVYVLSPSCQQGKLGLAITKA